MGLLGVRVVLRLSGKLQLVGRLLSFSVFLSHRRRLVFVVGEGGKAEEEECRDTYSARHTLRFPSVSSPPMALAHSLRVCLSYFSRPNNVYYV